MKVLRNRKCIVDWNEWKGKDKKEDIKKEIKKIGKNWISEKEIDIINNVEQEEWIEELNKGIKQN